MTKWFLSAIALGVAFAFLFTIVLLRIVTSKPDELVKFWMPPPLSLAVLPEMVLLLMSVNP